MKQKHINAYMPILAFCVGTVVSFFTLPLWVAFAVNLAREGNRADWLGFCGSVIGAAVALAAAAIAWLAVQKQIGLQQAIANQQTAIQQFMILREVISVLQDDDRMNDLVKLESSFTKIIEGSLRNTPLQKFHVINTIEFMENRVKSLTALGEEFERSAKNRWAFPTGASARAIVRAMVSSLNAEMSTAVLKVTQIKHNIELNGGTVNASDQFTASTIDFSARRKEIETRCNLFETMLSSEMRRVASIMSAVRQRADI